jgi:hypothetical protein
MPAPSSSLDIIKANFKRRRDIQAELREIDESTVTDADTGAMRSYTDDEQTKIETFRSELESIDSRIVSQLEMESRGQQITSGIESLLGSVIDRQSGDLVDERSLGQRFATNDYGEWAKQARGKFVADLPGIPFRNAVSDATTSSGSAGTLTRAER